MAEETNKKKKKSFIRTIVKRKMIINFFGFFVAYYVFIAFLIIVSIGAIGAFVATLNDSAGSYATSGSSLGQGGNYNQSSGFNRGSVSIPSTARNKLVVPVRVGAITSLWGDRWGAKHTGMDFGVNRKTDEYCYAAYGGKVVYAGWNANGYGYEVIIHHPDLGIYTQYGHLKKNSFVVSDGDVVNTGDPIAIVGNTGKSMGIHVHFEVRLTQRPGAGDTKNKPNPANYLFCNGKSVYEGMNIADCLP